METRAVLQDGMMSIMIRLGLLHNILDELEGIKKSCNGKIDAFV